ncbi:hypothetical protein PT974_12512 [Cladobotryum mycophilum]|uniref:Uncharacterized protein n=1 Tax=Cladobotryum mycophilum TaxID=491253 RepID=A0ABR0S869_9HYPO
MKFAPVLVAAFAVIAAAKPIDPANDIPSTAKVSVDKCVQCREHCKLKEGTPESVCIVTECGIECVINN